MPSIKIGQGISVRCEENCFYAIECVHHDDREERAEDGPPFFRPDIVVKPDLKDPARWYRIWCENVRRPNNG